MSLRGIASRGKGFPALYPQRASMATRPGLVLLPVVLAFSVALGFLITRSPVAAGLAVGTIAVVGAAAQVGRLVLAQVALGSLPWFVVFADVMPPLVKTFTSAFAVVAVLVLVAPVRLESRAVRAGTVLFTVALVCQAALATDAEQFIQASKYLLFPAITVAVVSEGARDELARLRNVLLASGIAALGVHVAVVVAGVGTATYYGVGEKLGFASHPHDLALLGMIVAAAGLTTAKGSAGRFAYLCIGTLPAIATGVRSAMLAVIVVVAIFLLQSRFSLRSLAVVAGLVVVAFMSGAAGIVASRYQESVEQGQFASLASAGSGRPSLWSVSVRRWYEDGPKGWLIGTGLGSTQRFSLEEIGESFGGHSDVVDVGVQLGVIGFLGWVLLWLGLLSRLRAFVLVPVVVYSIVNGGIEYVDSLVFGLALAAACALAPEDRVRALAWPPRRHGG